jgi:16S rRNA (cytidine1402-2'-O)-methyltransferase
MTERGTLTLVPTPIGNLEDITLRALRVLREADVIACEDTRTSSVLLRRYEIEKPLLSLHRYNERERGEHLLALLAEGRKVAVISDAGTPGISDPGFLLFRDAIAAGFETDVLPGPSAVLPALLLSGFPPQPFFFYGFPPENPGRRKRLFASLASCPCAAVLYVSPHKAARHTAELAGLLGGRRAALVREISKIHQETIRAALPEIASRLERGLKGEMVLVVEGCGDTEEPWREEAERLLGEGLSARTVAEEISGRFRVPKNEVKRFALDAERNGEAEKPD